MPPSEHQIGEHGAVFMVGKNGDVCVECGKEVKPNRKSTWIKGMEKKTGKSFKPEEPHPTMDNYCCACEYDLAVMNEKIAEAREEVLVKVEKKLKSIAMIDNGNSPKYFVKDVLKVLEELK